MSTSDSYSRHSSAQGQKKLVVDQRLRSIVNRILEIGGDKILFIALFGSRAEGYSRASSDYDVAIYYEGDKKERYEFLFKVLGKMDDDIDVKIFQDLPLVLKSKILSHGVMLYVRDYDDLLRIANKVRWEYEDFRPRLKLILG